MDKDEINRVHQFSMWYNTDVNDAWFWTMYTFTFGHMVKFYTMPNKITLYIVICIEIKIAIYTVYLHNVSTISSKEGI